MKTPKTFKELFANSGIEPTTDESGNTHYNFKATLKEKQQQTAVGLKNNLLENLIELNKRAIFENWKMEDVGEEFFKIFAYSDKPISSECEHKNKTQHFSDVFGHYTSCTNCGRDF